MNQRGSDWPVPRVSCSRSAEARFPMPASRLSAMWAAIAIAPRRSPARRNDLEALLACAPNPTAARAPLGVLDDLLRRSPLDIDGTAFVRKMYAPRVPSSAADSVKSCIICASRSRAAIGRDRTRRERTSRPARRSSSQPAFLSRTPSATARPSAFFYQPCLDRPRRSVRDRVVREMARVEDIPHAVHKSSLLFRSRQEAVLGLLRCMAVPSRLRVSPAGSF